VTIAFLTLAFAQLWHVFDMRGAGEGLLANDVTRNRWVWAALTLCAALLAVPPYVTQTAQLLQLEPPTAPMWGIVLTCSLAPLLVTQAAMELARLRRERRR
jgi:P-type Ca2+ transporter type 2C